MTRPPAAEMVEAFAWFAPPFAVLLLALLWALAVWALAARRTRRRDAKFAAEDERIEAQRKREQLARKEVDRG